MANLELLIDRLKRNGAIRVQRVEGAFRVVPRANFVPQKLCAAVYEDYPLPIGFGATISQPTTVAFMLEKLDVQPGQKVLDVGSGSGWTTALLSYLASPGGKVVGLEIVPELVAFGQKNLENFYSHILENMRIEVEHAEILQAQKGTVGFPEEAPFDRILVSAAAKEVPQELVNQLKPDGVLVLPVGKQPTSPLGAFHCKEYPQSLIRIHKKSDGTLETEEYPGFVFVPLQ